MPPGKRLFEFAIGAISLAGIAAGALSLGPQGLPRALADAPPPPPTPSAPHYTFPSGINQVVWTQPDAPQLTNFELEPVVAPGGLIKVDGTGFGAQRGTGSLCLIWTNILVQNPYTANDEFCADVVDWSDTRVIAQLSRDIEGVPDETAYVVLRRDDGEESNALAISFVATRAEVPIGSAPVNVQIDCVNYTADDNCSVYGGAHSAGFPFSTGTSGTDTYHFHLANGWTFDKMNFSVDSGSVSRPSTPPNSASDFTFVVNWSYGGFTTDAIYRFDLFVVGPKGVPMQ